MSYDDPDQVPPHRDEPYGFMERELVFKLMASHALVDAEYFELLRNDPEEAAAQLHIRLTERDLNYLKNNVEGDAVIVAPDAGGGKLAREWRGVKVAGHVDEVLQAVKAL